MNFILPVEEGVFPMHCSANDSKEGGDVAIFLDYQVQVKPHYRLIPLEY